MRKEIELKWEDWWCSLQKKNSFLKAIGCSLGKKVVLARKKSGAHLEFLSKLPPANKDTTFLSALKS